MLLHRSLRIFVSLGLLAVGFAVLPDVVRAAATDADDLHTTTTFTAVVDTTISSTTPNTPADADTSLRVNAAAATVAEGHALLDFDLTSIPVGAIVTKAELRLYQTAATPPGSFLVDIHRIAQTWNAPTTTWNTRPTSFAVITSLAVTDTTNTTVALDVTAVVQSWLHNPPGEDEFGLLIAPAVNGQTVKRVFASTETDTPPRLVVEYTPKPTRVSVTHLATSPKLDGLCDRVNDYANVTALPYSEIDGQVYNIFLRQDATDLYVCVEGTTGAGLFPQREFGVYIDADLTNNAGGNTTPDADDIALTIRVEDDTRSTTNFDGADWDAQAVELRSVESAEFRIDLAALADKKQPWCGAAFGLGVFHEDVRTVGDTYGWPSAATTTGPDTWVQTRLTNPPCPIRVCMEDAACTLLAINANVLRTADGASFGTDNSGYVQNRSQILNGDALWAMVAISETEHYTVYATGDDTPTVDFAAFNGATPGIMTLVVSEEHPLLVHDLDVSAQWLLGDAQRAWLRDQVGKASNVLYATTDGQVLLGDVTVRQGYEGWPAADLWLYTNNNLRPGAAPGGIGAAPPRDPGGGDVSYYPGHMHMGRAWNRYHRPPGEPITVNGVPIDLATLADDWAIVMVHEFGHYALYLFDAYYGVGLEGSVVTVNSCTGTIMGWAYEQSNWGFVNSPTGWAANCAETHANQLLGRNEWDVLQDNFAWLQRPAVFTPGPDAPPVNLTTVSFVEPAGGALLSGQTFDLLYDDGQTASRKAHAFLIRGDYVLSQGSPVLGSTQIELAGAQAGDRFCVYDIDAAPPSPHTPRHQYGCESLEAGDTTLDLERDDAWSPIVLIDPIGPTTIAVTITQPITGASLVARVFPEHAGISFTALLAPAGVSQSAVFTLPNVTPAAFVQVYVDEGETETDPRREAMAMYGVDGGTVPGPGSWDAKAPVYSSDGESVAWPLDAVIVKPGQWVSMQYMVETYPAPGQTTRVSDAYRVISWPPALAATVNVNIRTPLTSSAQAASLSAAGAMPKLGIRTWNGSSWQPVTTELVETEDGALVASAVVPANRVYALFDGDVTQFLPYARR